MSEWHSVNLDLFAGPGGWDEAARLLGLPVTGIELDAAACATRAAAGHATVRADVAAFPVDRLPGRVRGLIASPPCTTFSMAGKRAGNTALLILAEAIRDALEGRRTRAGRRRQMAAALRRAWWPDPKMTRAQRSAAIWTAVRSASLVIEPARFIAACRPEWVALEQVPSVLPLWQAYAAGLRAAGYSAWAGKLNAADYGVPQTRERAVLIASRARRVQRPEPTHYDPRKGDQLWGDRWVTMAQALGWGADGRPAVAVTAGGTATGGAEPFGNQGRAALEAERDAGRWMLRTTYGSPLQHSPGFDPSTRPSRAVVSKTGDWLLHTNRDQRPDGLRQTADPTTAPAPALTAKSGGQWVLRTSYGQPHTGPKRDGNGSCGTHKMDPAQRPAHAVTGKAKNRALTRPAATVQDSVRITVAEAAVLQSFPPDYPWQGTKTAQFRQVGDAWGPLAAIHVLGMATGIDPREAAERYREAIYGPQREIT